MTNRKTSIAVYLCLAIEVVLVAVLEFVIHTAALRTHIPSSVSAKVIWEIGGVLILLTIIIKIRLQKEHVGAGGDDALPPSQTIITNTASGSGVGLVAEKIQVGGKAVVNVNILSSQAPPSDKPAPAGSALPPTPDQLADMRVEYLRRLAGRIGTVNLASLSATDASSGGGAEIGLEQVYVDGPTQWWIHADKNGRIRLTENGNRKDELTPRLHPDGSGDEHDREPTELGLDEANLRNIWDAKSGKKPIRLHIWDAAVSARRLVVLGDPGSGKSCFARYLALRLAADALAPERARILRDRAEWPNGKQIPVYVELRRFVLSPHYPSDGVNPDESHLWNFIKAELRTHELDRFGDALHADLKGGQAVLLLDGLDEVPFKAGFLTVRQEEIKHLAADIVRLYRDTRIVVTSRPYAYRAWMLKDFKAVLTLGPFESSYRTDMVGRIYRAVGMAFHEADAKAKALEARLVELPIGYNDRPLFITLLAALFLLRGELPKGKGPLYAASIDLLLERWLKIKRVPTGEGNFTDCSLADLIDLPEGALHKEALLTNLAALAFAVQIAAADGGGLPDIPCEMIDTHLRPLDRWCRNAVIAYLSDTAGVLVSPGHGLVSEVFQFAHLSFQEYLAADYLVQKGDEPRLRELMIEKPELWREVGLLAGEALAHNRTRIFKLVADLVGPEEEGRDEICPYDGFDGTDKRWWPLWLAAALCETHDLIENHRAGSYEEFVCAKLIAPLRTLIETPSALPPPDRALCGRVLSALGDLRPGVGLRNGLPDIVWRPVPAGAFTYQDGETRSLPAFCIAKYPITYRQYKAFIDATDGYQNGSWWTGLHKEGRDQQRKGSGEQAFQFDNHPRERVSWYDAVAFCRWLTAKLGYEIRLPSEEEWEKAARGSYGREYPWGNGYREGFANIAERFANAGQYYVGKNTAVGMYPQGSSPCGALDMSGNVWEWTSTEYESRSDANEGSNARRALRGGSWNYDHYGARAVYRNDVKPVDRRNVIGFRPVAPADFSESVSSDSES